MFCSENLKRKYMERLQNCLRQLEKIETRPKSRRKPLLTKTLRKVCKLWKRSRTWLVKKLIEKYLESTRIYETLASEHVEDVSHVFGKQSIQILHNIRNTKCYYLSTFGQNLQYGENSALLCFRLKHTLEFEQIGSLSIDFRPFSLQHLVQALAL